MSSDNPIFKGFSYKISHRVYTGGVPVDLTGMTAKLTLKSNAALPGVGLITLTSPNGGITILDQSVKETLGAMICKFTRAQTDGLAVGSYYFDIALIDGSDMWNTSGVRKIMVVASPNDDSP